MCHGGKNNKWIIKCDHTSGHKCNFKPDLPHISLNLTITNYQIAFQGGTVVKNLPPVQRCKRHNFNPWVGKILWRRKWQPTPVLLPGKSHGQRSLAAYSQRGHKESEMTEGLSMHNYQIHLNIRDVHVRKVGW